MTKASPSGAILAGILLFEPSQERRQRHGPDGGDQSVDDDAEAPETGAEGEESQIMRSLGGQETEEPHYQVDWFGCSFFILQPRLSSCRT